MREGEIYFCLFVCFLLNLGLKRFLALVKEVIEKGSSVATDQSVLNTA